MVVLALAGAVAASQGQNPLHAVKCLGGRQRLMAARVLDAVVVDDTEVVAVGQDAVEAAHGDWLTAREALCATGAQPSCGDALVDLRAAVLAGREQIEELGNDLTALRINRHGTDFVTIKLLADVDVTELGAGDRAATLGLLTHLVAYVGGAGLRLVLVNGVHDGFDELALWRLIQVKHRGDNARANLAQVTLGNAGVDGIAKDPVEVVDDDVVNVVLSLHPRHHLLKDRPLVYGRGRSTGLDELIDDLSAQLIGLPFASFALGRNGNAFGVVVGRHLARIGDTQVEHRSLALGGGLVLVSHWLAARVSHGCRSPWAARIVCDS